MGWDDVDALLGREIGLDPETVGVGLVRHAVEGRMAALSLDDLDAYVRKLNGSADERRHLIEAVVIPESWFFRDSRPFAFLAAQAASGELADPPDETIRLLSLPCSTGEEPYTIAMTLLDAGLPPGRFRVEAVDVSDRALARAARGIYTRNAFRGADLAYRDRYFTPAAHGFEIGPAAREPVRFRMGNVLDPDLFRDEPPFDVLFCRNLLIYLSGPARVKALATLGRLVRAGGLLFVGHAETISMLDAQFTKIRDRGSFAFRRSPAALPAPADRPSKPPSPTRPDPRLPRDRDVKTSRPTAPRKGPEPRLDPPRNAPTSPAPAAPTGASLLARAAELANARQFGEAAALCERAIAESRPSAEAFFLLGTIRQAFGDLDRAERCFQQAVYLDGRHDEALLALALIADRRGDRASADGYRRRAARASSRKEVR